MVHMNNGILLSHKKEWIWVSTNEVDEPRADHTEWSMSERENQILYIKAYTWSLERLYWWTYLQGSNGDADREQTHRPGEREMERVGPVERAPWKHRHCHLWNRQPGGICCMTQGTQTRLFDNLEGWEVGGRLTRAGTYVYLWLSQWYVRNLYNIVKQLSFKKNLKNCEKKKNYVCFATSNSHDEESFIFASGSFVNEKASTAVHLEVFCSSSPLPVPG